MGTAVAYSGEPDRARARSMPPTPWPKAPSATSASNARLPGFNLAAGFGSAPWDGSRWSAATWDDSRRKQPRVVEEPREMLVDEWTVGSYQRDVELRMPVDGSLATATYEGVLVVALPLAKRTYRAGEPGARRH